MEPALQTLQAEGTACANALRQEESVQQQQPGEGERLESKGQSMRPSGLRSGLDPEGGGSHRRLQSRGGT